MTKVFHREIARSFLTLAASGSVREAYSLYVAFNFRHHNPHFHGDRESLMLAMEDNAVKNPSKKLEIRRTLDNGDPVAAHSLIRQNADDPGTAVVHIFRFEGDHIVELWDLGQAIPKGSPNENGML